MCVGTMCAGSWLQERAATLYTRGLFLRRAGLRLTGRRHTRCTDRCAHTRCSRPSIVVSSSAPRRVARVSIIARRRGTRVGRDTGAGPVGSSSDIKISGHAAQEATRSCIVVQVQWVHLATTQCVVAGGARRDSRDFCSSTLSLSPRRSWWSRYHHFGRDGCARGRRESSANELSSAHVS